MESLQQNPITILLLIGSFAFGYHIVASTLGNDATNPIGWMTFGALPALLFQAANSSLAESMSGALQWYLLLLILCLVTTYLLQVGTSSRLTATVHETTDTQMAIVCGVVGLFSFLLLIETVGGLAVYSQRVENEFVTWEGMVAALAYFSGLSIFAAFFFQRMFFVRRRGRWLALGASLIFLLPFALPAILLFKRTGTFVVFVYLALGFSQIFGMPKFSRFMLTSYLLLPMLSFFIVLGLPYLRTQFYTSADYGRNNSFEDYQFSGAYSEVDYGVGIVDAITGGCGELGYGRRFISQLVSVFVPKVTGLKEDLLDRLSFQDLRDCSTIQSHPNVFLTGIGEAGLDFGYFGPVLIVVVLMASLRMTNNFGDTGRFAYLSILCTIFPIALIWGPMYVVINVVPLLLINALLRIRVRVEA